MRVCGDDDDDYDDDEDDDEDTVLIRSLGLTDSYVAFRYKLKCLCFYVMQLITLNVLPYFEFYNLST